MNFDIKVYLKVENLVCFLKNVNIIESGIRKKVMIKNQKFTAKRMLVNQSNFFNNFH